MIVGGLREPGVKASVEPGVRDGSYDLYHIVGNLDRIFKDSQEVT